MKETEQIEIQLSKSKLTLLFLGSVMFVGLGAWIVSWVNSLAMFRVCFAPTELYGIRDVRFLLALRPAGAGFMNIPSILFLHETNFFLTLGQHPGHLVQRIVVRSPKCGIAAKDSVSETL